MSDDRTSIPEKRVVHPVDAAERTEGSISSFRHDILVPAHLPNHHHDEHELICAWHGSIRVSTASGSWQLAPGTALWVPLGQIHAMSVTPPASLSATYVTDGDQPSGERWTRTHALTPTDLTRSLVRRLEAGQAPPAHRDCHEKVFITSLYESAYTDSALPVPTAPHAAIVAAAILDNPADPRTLADWAAELKVSTRTLARAFMADTELSFSEWRTNARINASMVPLNNGMSVTSVAAEVGYASPSAFISAFRAQLGCTPGAYARTAAPRHHP